MIPTLRTKVNDIVWGFKLEQRGMPGRVLAVILRYLYGLIRDMFSGQLSLRAMSLVYTTLLAIVPLIAFSFSVLQGFGVHNRLEPLLFELLSPLGDQGAEITRQIIDLVDGVRGGVLGGISLAFFIYTAISMVQKVEESFNYVWYVAKSRSLARRLTEYMIVLLIGPVVIVIALGMIASLRSNTLVQLFLTSKAIGPLLVVTNKLTPYVLVTAVFTFLYMYMPNTRVRFKSALVGGIAGGFIWASISVIFATFVLYSTRTQLIYSGFAVAIITLIWLYLNWLVLLIGAQLAYYFQNPAFLRIGRREPRLSNAMRERLALNVMLLVGRAFRDPDSSITVDEISDKLRMPSIALAPVVAALEDGGLLATTEKEDLLPGKDMATIRLDDILSVVRVHGETGSYRDPKWSSTIDALGKDLDDAVLATVGTRTLVDLLEPAAVE
ncbi:MAG: YihY/virulence factor BrkB family protein [Gammaproteobacteria bacterium]|nr:YihY/virulence factor BrkB family protein [Gammaproteobacteria bacterium]MDH3372201.1 YihY/virulence factor BrkB family protein [Gammaproteobacteria bacterium]